MDKGAVVARVRLASPPERALIATRGQGMVIAEGPGVLDSVLIANQGCCSFIVRDGDRLLFRMSPAFAGSFRLGFGFLENLTVDMNGEFPAHLHISFRLAAKRGRS